MSTENKTQEGTESSKTEKSDRKVRAVLVNLEAELCDEFHAIAKANDSNATATARRLITEFIVANRKGSRTSTGASA